MRIAILDDGVRSEYVIKNVNINNIVDVSETLEKNRGIHGTAVINTFGKYCRNLDEIEFDVYNIIATSEKGSSSIVKEAFLRMNADVPDVILLSFSIKNKDSVIEDIEQCMKQLSDKGAVIFGASTMEDELCYPATSEYTIGIKKGIFGPNASFLYHEEETAYCETCCYPEWIPFQTTSLLFGGTSKAVPCIAAQYVNACIEKGEKIAFSEFVAMYSKQEYSVEPYSVSLGELTKLDLVIIDEIRNCANKEIEYLSNDVFVELEFSDLFEECDDLAPVLPIIASKVGIELDICQLNFADVFTVSNFVNYMRKRIKNEK